MLRTYKFNVSPFFLPLPITSMSKHHIRLASSKNNQIPNSCNILNLTKKLLLVIIARQSEICLMSTEYTLNNHSTLLFSLASSNNFWQKIFEGHKFRLGTITHPLSYWEEIMKGDTCMTVQKLFSTRSTNKFKHRCNDQQICAALVRNLIKKIMHSQII